MIETAMPTYEHASNTQPAYELASNLNRGGRGIYDMAAKDNVHTTPDYELAAQLGVEAPQDSNHGYDVANYDAGRETVMFDDVHGADNLLDGDYALATHTGRSNGVHGSDAVYEMGSLPFWYLPGTARNLVRAVGDSIVANGVPGNFFVREKQSVSPRKGREQPSATLALNVLQDDGELGCFIVEELNGLWSLRGTFREDFTTVIGLVKHYLEGARASMVTQPHGNSLVLPEAALFTSVLGGATYTQSTEADYELASNLTPAPNNNTNNNSTTTTTTTADSSHSSANATRLKSNPAAPLLRDWATPRKRAAASTDRAAAGSVLTARELSLDGGFGDVLRALELQAEGEGKNRDSEDGDGGFATLQDMRARRTSDSLRATPVTAFDQPENGFVILKDQTLRVKSVRRGNPLYVASMYQEGNHFTSL